VPHFDGLIAGQRTKLQLVRMAMNGFINRGERGTGQVLFARIHYYKINRVDDLWPWKTAP
jgi:hypothetical protein